MFRLIAIGLAVLTSLGGGLLAWSHLAELEPGHAFCRLGFCGAGSPTIQTEPTNPFGWSDLAEEKATAGDLRGAREAFAQSVRLGPHIPPVLIRVVNFEVANGSLDRAAPHLRHILELTAVYDNVAFRYLVRSGIKQERILADVIPDPGSGSAEQLARRIRAPGGHASAPDGESRPKGDAARGWVSYLIADRHAEAERAWRWLDERGGVTPELRNQWIEYLVGVRKEYPKAMAVWAAAHREEGYPGRNRIFNSRFAHERTGNRMDWALSPHPHVAAKTDSGGLTLVFDGKENTAYGHLSQQTYLPAGRWRFAADAEAEGLTTDQRPFFRIDDAAGPRRLDVSTPMAPERMAVEFTSPAGGSWVSIALQRRQSEKFDNKIQGTLRIREVRMERANGGT